MMMRGWGGRAVVVFVVVLSLGLLPGTAAPKIVGEYPLVHAADTTPHAQPELEVSRTMANGMGNLVLTASANEGSSPTVDLPPNPTLMAGQLWMIKVNDLKSNWWHG